MPNLFNREGLPAIPFSKDARVENALKTSISSPKYISKQDISYVSATEKDAYRLERCKLDIYYPAGKQGFATIVWFHGGGLEEGWRFIPEELKNAEIAVVPVNYRLYPQAKNPAYTVDVAESIAWVFANIEKFGGDKMKIYIAGHSAGAYLALMVGLDKSYLAKHNVDADKIRGLIPISGQTNTHWAVKKEYGMDDYMPFIDRFAPIFHARKNAPSTLLITGDRKLEMIARYEENAHLEAMLKYYGSEVTLYELQGFDHNTMLAPACRLLLKWIK
ncbi:MAG: alpha/beta hydrolase [Dysgonamonadaceae bacterium]|nr:alpha/beta hydrolase [Dysgonamonadaceae bacterium]